MRAVGAVLTMIGLALFAYALGMGLVNGRIGSAKQWTPDALAVLAGWFLLMIGPALYFGKTPSRIVSTVERERNR